MKFILRGGNLSKPNEQVKARIDEGDTLELFDEDSKRILTLHWEDGALVLTMAPEAFLSVEAYRQIRDAAG